MSQKFDICIVHKNERCHWLAKEMASYGWKVALIDVAQPVESWPPEDCEGPYGVLKSPQLMASQWSMLTDSRLVRESEKGFVVWVNEFGPLELKGPLYSYHKSIHPALAYAEDYFQDSDMASPEVVELYNQKIAKKSFSENWLVQLAHNFASNEYSTNAESIRSKRPYPLYYNYIVRRPSHKEYIEALDSLEEAGVSVFRKAQVKDLRFESKSLQGAEVSTQNFSQFLQADKWFWCLSEYETRYHFPKIYSQLFSAEPMLPEWAWIRYRIKFNENACIEQLPNQSLLIEDIHSPWAHANFVQCIRSDVSNEFDFWIRIPELERYRKEYLEEMRDKILQHLNRKIPNLEIVNHYMPQEYYYSSSELGPALYSVYDSDHLKKQSHKAIKNLKFDGPQFWSRHDEVYRLLYHAKIWKEWKTNEERINDRSLHSARDGESMESRTPL